MNEKISAQCRAFDRKLIAALQVTLEEGVAICSTLPEKDRPTERFYLNTEILDTLLLTACRMAVRVGLSRLSFICKALHGYKKAHKDIEG